MCSTEENIFTAEEKKIWHWKVYFEKHMAFTLSDVNVKAPIDFSGNMIVSNG